MIDINSFVPITKAYIDPGTGSMLFTVLIGLISAGIYAFRGLLIKLRYSFSKDKTKINDDVLPYVIYAESKRYWNSFKSICDEFEKRNIDVTYYTSSKDDPVFNQEYKHIKPECIGESNSAFAKLNMLKANIVLSTTPSLDVYQWKRSKNVKYYVHIPHMANDITTYRMFGIDYYDAILTSNEFQIEQVRKLEELRNLPPKDMKAVGLTYFDEMKKRLDSVPKVNNDIPVVLLAPSWGPSSILNKYGSKIIDSLKETGYQIVVRPHPQSYTSEKDMLDNLMKKYPNIEWNKDNDNFDILNKADILISDFSGVIFDFSLVFDKPVIYADTSFDYSIYDAYWLKEGLWTFKALPELGEQLKEDNLFEIKSIIDNCLNDNKYQLGRNKIRNEAWFNIRSSAKEIVDYLENKEEELTK
ncbi:MAG: CDP-glycerol glycerophosphotransferase family protein [Firmicutes bacterium]|nr:CDP-glycerol glycerophosphotransferase family protein [Candidatus Colivicinus equi]